MNREDFDKLVNIEEQVLTSECLKDKTPRTLLFGYTCSRDTWHVYLNQLGEIVTVMYGYADDAPLNTIKITQNQEFNPDKRLYPNKCDFEFCKALKSLGVYLSFTTFEETEEKAFYGRIY